MKRRTALRVVTLGTLAPLGFEALSKMGPGGTAWAAENYQLHFFTPEENELLDQLMEMIIPADNHSPGAHAAQVSLFADLMVSTSSDQIKNQWRNGLKLLRQEAARSSLAEALAINGYYTSAIGSHQDLQYVGNTYLPSFPGCTRSPQIIM